MTHALQQLLRQRSGGLARGLLVVLRIVGDDDWLAPMDQHRGQAVAVFMVHPHRDDLQPKRPPMRRLGAQRDARSAAADRVDFTLLDVVTMRENTTTPPRSNTACVAANMLALAPYRRRPGGAVPGSHERSRATNAPVRTGRVGARQSARGAQTRSSGQSGP